MKDSKTAVPAVPEKMDVVFVEIPCISLSLRKDTTKIMDSFPVGNAVLGEPVFCGESAECLFMERIVHLTRFA